MASSDDEGETVPHAVSNYHFVNDKDEPISLSELPVQWNEGEGLDGKRKQIFLRGTADNGLQKIYKQVTKWKFDLSAAQPLISVLSKENNWIKLQKPRKSFEEMIRTTLITVQCLHLVKKNPEMSGRSLWDHLAKVFSLYETRPSENDLIDHMSLISEAVKVDKTLAKSKFLLRFLEEKPPNKVFDENIGTTTDDRFIVDDDMIDEIEEDDGSDEEDDLYDSVCSICDNGGDILCCEGRCMRSFHATEEAGSESMCDSLGLSNEQVEAMQNFLCKNCQYKKHQCFSCGVLGSSDKLSGAEVFPCVSATCGRFYHPHCVAKLLHPESAADAEVLQNKISAGDAFTCPIHKCIICKQGENKMDPDLQFAVCRRCPKSYHRKCLPREIAFEDLEEEDIVQRAWEDLIPNRILIYCLKHEIDDEIGTPIRNHLKFPGDGKKKKKQESVQLTSKGKVLRKESTLAAPDAPRKRTLGEVQRGADLSLTPKEGDLSKKNMRRSTGLDSSKKRKLGDISRKPLDRKVCKSITEENGPSLGERLYYMTKGSESFKSRKDDRSGHKQILVDKPVAKEISKELPLDDDSKKRILALVKEAASSVTMEKIIDEHNHEHNLPTNHANSLKNVVDKTITLGKVEGSVEALRAALQKLEGGGSIEDAKAVCEPQLLNQMVKWKNKLKVYLAPFLHGKRYTSYGRHFTKVNKLKEIVDRLHCYVQDGDMIVDFCCGANDFSLLMKKKLDETGRNCSYKNYDKIQAKSDFNFEKKDWFKVNREELPTGSQLIMGLNPPFGVNASLANKFINKALEFKPKLLILIVPKETERLDKKKSPYHLVWEDDELLAGKSFYLPGSVDVNDNQLEDWNKETPPLYLWSRPDWTETHKAIAQKHGHVTRLEERPYLEDPHETLVPDSPMEVHDLNGQASKSVDDHPIENVYEQLQERGAGVPERQNVVNSDNGEREVQVDCRLGKNNSDGDSKKKRQHGKGKHGRGSGDKSQECKEKELRSLHEVHDRIPCSSPTNVARVRSPGGHSSKVLGASMHVVVGEEDQHHVQHNVAPIRSQFQTSYDETRADDIARRYGLNNNEPYSGTTTHRWSSGTSPSLGPDYGLRNSEGQFTGYQRESTDGRGYRSYLGDMEEKYPREPAVRSHVPLHGQQYHEPLSQRSSYSAGGDPGFSSSYSHRGPAGDSSYKAMNTNTSTMQRYAPRLDELNHTRMSTFGTEPPTASRNGGPDPLAQQPGYRVDPLGFAPAPYRPFSPHNSSGWLHE